ncbi:hypothetical protein KCU97_g4010, partial [Aureobasidium melanogenum]
TDLQGIKSLLAQKRARLSYAPLPEWQQNEVTSALAQVETCIQRMEISSYVCSVVKDSVVAVLKSTLDQVRRGEIFTGASGSALQAAVVMIDKQDILDAVFQRANLEALDSDITIKKHVVAALAGLVQREMFIIALSNNVLALYILPSACASLSNQRTLLQPHTPAASLSASQAEMENTKSEPDLKKIHEAVEAALTKIHDAQIDNHDPSKTKEDTDHDLVEASNLLAQAKENIAAQSIDAKIGHAVDFVVAKIDSLPRDHAVKGAPNVHAPDWPEVRDDLIKQVKVRLEAYFFQLEEGMLMMLDPKVFESQARREASVVVFGKVQEMPEILSKDL